MADNSPVPVIIYSFPSATGGLEIDSDSVVTLAKHPNIVGIKQTDHNVGKMARISYQVKRDQSNFVVLGGASEYLTGALSVGAVSPALFLSLVDNRGFLTVGRHHRSGEHLSSRSDEVVQAMA